MNSYTEDSEKVDTRLLPRLTKLNWSTIYKNAAMCLALNYGEAGEIIITGRDLILPVPNLTDFMTYLDTDRGDRAFNIDKERFR